ncbi:HAD family hydrolase [Halovivax gelatinilyticus]|uniref:HAD family hydrolase n=1 Tax=Halovivax gelatinilyticus TaxID=2961597 RepID=UPI0020CA94C2|nr:HAD family hydrolase [Halovivax gelatinilyticus]
MTAVTTVLFDLDETICTHPTPSSERLAAAFDRAGVEPFFEAADYHRLVGEIGGTGSDVRRREVCFRRLARKAGYDEAVGLRVADAYRAVTDYTAAEFLPDAKAVLDTLADRYRLGLVTNGGPDTQSVKIDALGLRDRFETVVLAGYETAAKPDPEPFETAMADLGSSPEAAIYVGNSPEHDVAGGAACGMRTVWYPDDANDGCSVTPDYRIDSLDELLDPPWNMTG